jgi:hypothetical protein
LVLICIGFMSICVLPASIALLVFWIRENIKRYYGLLPPN